MFLQLKMNSSTVCLMFLALVFGEDMVSAAIVQHIQNSLPLRANRVAGNLPFQQLIEYCLLLIAAEVRCLQNDQTFS